MSKSNRPYYLLDELNKMDTDENAFVFDNDIARELEVWDIETEFQRVIADETILQHIRPELVVTLSKILNKHIEDQFGPYPESQL